MEQNDYDCRQRRGRRHVHPNGEREGQVHPRSCRPHLRRQAGDERLKRLARIDLVDARGGELAGGSDRPDRVHATADDSDGADIPRKRPPSPRKDFDEFDDGGGDEISRLTNIVYAVFSYLAVLAIGTILGWYIFHQTVYVAVDPYTGQVIGILKEHPPQNSPQNSPTPDSSPSKQGQPNPSKPQRDDAHR